MVCCALTEQVTANSNAVIVRFIKTIVKYTLEIHLRCKAYLTKSGLMVFGFCPAGSTQRDFLSNFTCSPANTPSQSLSRSRL